MYLCIYIYVFICMYKYINMNLYLCIYMWYIYLHLCSLISEHKQLHFPLLDNYTTFYTTTPDLTQLHHL